MACSIGSTETVLVLDFFLSGSELDGGVGDFVFPVEAGKLRCLSWYFARFGCTEMFRFVQRNISGVMYNVRYTTKHYL